MSPRVFAVPPTSLALVSDMLCTTLDIAPCALVVTVTGIKTALFQSVDVLSELYMADMIPEILLKVYALLLCDAIYESL